MKVPNPVHILITTGCEEGNSGFRSLTAQQPGKVHITVFMMVINKSDFKILAYAWPFSETKNDKILSDMATRHFFSVYFIQNFVYIS